MNRILPAAALALLIHVIFLGMNFSWLKSKTIVRPKTRMITITLANLKPEKPKSVPQKSAVPKKQIQKKIKKYKPKPNLQKEISKPSVKPLPPPEPEKNNQHAEPETSNIVDDVSNMQVVHEARPLYRLNPPPEYPETARRRGYQGTVVLEVLIDSKGKVDNLRISKSSGYSILDRTAFNQVKKWVFEPGKRGNKPMEMWVKVPVTFQLQ